MVFKITFLKQPLKFSFFINMFRYLTRDVNFINTFKFIDALIRRDGDAISRDVGLLYEIKYFYEELGKYIGEIYTFVHQFVKCKFFDFEYILNCSMNVEPLKTSLGVCFKLALFIFCIFRHI